MKTTALKPCLALAMLLILGAGLCADTWFNDYDNAKKAIKDKKWDKAVNYLQEALKEESEPRLKAKTYGLRFIDYLPYYYLGVAYFGLGNYNEAQAAFEQSQAHGAVKERSREFSDLEQKIADCLKKLQPKNTPPPVTTEPGTEPADKETETPVDTPTGTPVKEQVKKETQETAAKKPVTQTPEPEKDEVVQKETLPDPLLVEAVENLNRGIQYYFRGEPRKAEGDLIKAAAFLKNKNSHPDLEIRAYMFLAVILIERHYLEGEGSGNIPVQALDYIKGIKALDPGFTLDERYFSPKVAEQFKR